MLLHSLQTATCKKNDDLNEDDNLFLTINNVVIKQVQETKFLGVIIDKIKQWNSEWFLENRVSWKLHAVTSTCFGNYCDSLQPVIRILPDPTPELNTFRYKGWLKGYNWILTMC